MLESTFPLKPESSMPADPRGPRPQEPLMRIPLAFLALLAAFVPAAGQEVADGTRVVRAVPAEILLCPGETASITICVEKAGTVGGKRRWTRLAGQSVDYAQAQTL